MAQIRSQKKQSNTEVLELLCRQKTWILSMWQLVCRTGNDLSRPTEPAIACVWYWYHAFQQAAFWFCTFWRQPCVQSARVFGARTIERLMNDLVLALALCTTLVDTPRSDSNTSTSNVAFYISMQRYFLLKEFCTDLDRHPRMYFLFFKIWKSNHISIKISIKFSLKSIRKITLLLFFYHS